jgi:hypothetical protein
MMATVGLVPFWILNKVDVSGQLKFFNWLRRRTKWKRKSQMKLDSRVQ